MSRRRLFGLVMLTLCAAAAEASTHIYKYVDAEGVAHFTDTPDSPRYRLLDLTLTGLTHSGDPYNPRLLARAARYDALIDSAAREAAVEPNLLRAVIVVESGFNVRAVSPRGAVGLMQLMPATAARFGVSDRYDPQQNVRGGASYLAFLITRFHQNVRLALAAYNAGEQAVDRSAGQIPPFAETQDYVPKVIDIYQTLNAQLQRPTLAALPSPAPGAGRGVRIP